ncbi:MAG: hypothetical protein ACYT04_80190, partial [Nostoc sp.]
MHEEIHLEIFLEEKRSSIALRSLPPQASPLLLSLEKVILPEQHSYPQALLREVGEAISFLEEKTIECVVYRRRSYPEPAPKGIAFL